MKRKPPPDRSQIVLAIARLKDARTLLANAGSPNAADYVRRALKSAEGALRHAERMHNDRARSPAPGTAYGTSHFVSMAAALTYYAGYGCGLERAAVQAKLAAGEIHLGPPPLKPGERLATIDNGARYAIVTA